MMKLLIVLGFVTFCTAYVSPIYYTPTDIEPVDGGYRFFRLPGESIDEHVDEETGSEHSDGPTREKRSLQPGAPGFPMPGQNLPTSVSSNVEKQGKNTIATINAQHKTDKYDVGATWSKVVRGPGKSKPNWSVGGTYRW